MNHYFTSTGERLTEEQIKRRLLKTYREMDGDDIFACEGCWKLTRKLTTCHAHIIPKARCKQLRKAELIYDEGNIFHSCFDCNAAIENPKGEAWKKLNNIDKCLSFINMHDSGLHSKFMNNIPV